MDNDLRPLRYTGRFEALTYIALIGVGMPLKYIWHKPGLNSILGMAHGLAFVSYSLLLVQCATARTIRTRTAWRLWLLSLLPFGPFWGERRYLHAER